MRRTPKCRIRTVADARAAVVFFFYNDTATTEIYTLSLHDALPICPRAAGGAPRGSGARTRTARRGTARRGGRAWPQDRKSTRLNSSHANISYAVFCLKKTTVSPTRNSYTASLRPTHTPFPLPVYYP